jgi:hypothetical protein
MVISMNIQKLKLDELKKLYEEVVHNCRIRGIQIEILKQEISLEIQKQKYIDALIKIFNQDDIN